METLVYRFEVKNLETGSEHWFYDTKELASWIRAIRTLEKYETTKVEAKEKQEDFLKERGLEQ